MRAKLVTEPKPDWAKGCTCPLDYRGLGILYGVSFGKGWVRLYDAPDCPVHYLTGEHWYYDQG